MLNTTQRLLKPLLERRKFKDDDELYLYLILNAATFYAVLVHLGFIILNQALRIPGMVVGDTAFFLLHCSGFLLIGRRHYALAGVVLSGLAFLFTFYNAWLVGTGHGALFYFFVVLIMQFIIPYAKLWVRVTTVVVLWLGVLVYLWLSAWYVPPVRVNAQLALTVYNAHVLLVGTIAQLTVGNLLKSVIGRLNQEEMSRYKQEALTDPLTGLSNRRAAKALFERLRAGQDQPWCAAMLDIDDFKRVNDTFGHAAGDEVLVALAESIRGVLRSSDQVYRWGGEEFLVMLQGVDLANAARVMEKLRSAVASLEVVAEGLAKPIRVTVTIGLAEVQGGQVETAVQYSDEKLYLGKSRGKNRVEA